MAMLKNRHGPRWHSQPFRVACWWRCYLKKRPRTQVTQPEVESGVLMEMLFKNGLGPRWHSQPLRVACWWRCWRQEPTQNNAPYKAVELALETVTIWTGQISRSGCRIFAGNQKCSKIYVEQVRVSLHNHSEVGFERLTSRFWALTLTTRPCVPHSALLPLEMLVLLVSSSLSPLSSLVAFADRRFDSTLLLPFSSALHVSDFMRLPILNREAFENLKM